MLNLQLTQFHFLDAQYFTEQQLQAIQQENDEIINIDYQYNLIIYSFPSNEYINLKDLLFFQTSKILFISQNQLIKICIEILKAINTLNNSNISYNKICLSNLWIWVSNPFSQNYNSEIEFKAFISMDRDFSWNEQNSEIDIQPIIKIIKLVLQNTDENLQTQLDCCNNRDQILSTLKEHLNQNDQGVNQSGSYDPKLIEDFLKNTQLSEQNFLTQFGTSYGNLLRNIILNWAIKHPKQFITQHNCKTLTINDITNQLNINGWFCNQIEKYKIFHLLMDTLFYSLQVEQALNDLEKIQNNSNFQSKFKSLNLVELLTQNQNKFFQTILPKQYYRENNESIMPQIIGLYNNEIKIFMTIGLEVMKNFYQHLDYLSINRIEQYQFYKVGLNNLDDILFDYQQKNNFQNLDDQYITLQIKENLEKYLKEEILQIFKKLINKQNQNIANNLLYKDQNKF